MSLILLDDSTPSPSLGPLSIDGKFFRQGGERMTIIESSDFSLFKRYLENEPIYDVVAQRKDLGFNMLRVWLLNTSVVPGGILPSQYNGPDFYKRLREFAAYIGFCGLHLDLTVFTQTQTLMPLLSDQQRHMDATGAAVEGLGHVILSRVNEGDQHDNETADGLRRPPYSVIYSAGSNGSDSIPPAVQGDCTEYHIIGSEWQRKTGHNAFEWAEVFNMPCWTSESQRCPDNDSNPNHYEDAAAGAALLCAGSCFHSAAGKLSTLFTGAELTCAEAHVRGAQSVPLEFQAGRYVHRTDLETPGILRAYERRLDDGRGYVVMIRE